MILKLRLPKCLKGRVKASERALVRPDLPRPLEEILLGAEHPPVGQAQLVLMANTRLNHASISPTEIVHMVIGASLNTMIDKLEGGNRW